MVQLKHEVLPPSVGSGDLTASRAVKDHERRVSFCPVTHRHCLHSLTGRRGPCRPVYVQGIHPSSPRRIDETCDRANLVCVVSAVLRLVAVLLSLLIGAVTL